MNLQYPSLAIRAPRLLALAATLAAASMLAGCVNDTASGSVYTYDQAQREQVVRHQPRPQTRQIARLGGVVADLAEARRGRIVGPVRRTQAAHAPALLIDQDHRFVPHAGFQRRDQRLHLIRRLDIAPEQDEAQRPDLGEEGPLLRRQFKPGTAENTRPDHAAPLSG